MSDIVQTTDRFFKGARELRRHFDARFADPHSADGGRFVWDYWHVPGQYTVLRTPAYHFFPPALYRQLHESLVLWGRENLGCHDISPPWLSCYVDGCRQEFHADLPHGPFAFVYSLTEWDLRRFQGGETFLLRPEILSLWKNLDRFQGMEENDVLQFVEPRFNRLTVFDPRVPHGVRKVEGVHDPREGRLVIHGWFVQPRPFISGPLKRASLTKLIRELTSRMEEWLAEAPPLRGVMSLRFRVTAAGSITSPKVLVNTLKSPDSEELSVKALEKRILQFMKGARLERTGGGSSVTLPLVFEG